MQDNYDAPGFEQACTYSGTDLGAIWTREETRLRLWAPTAAQVSLRLYRSGDPWENDLLEELPMEPDIRGTWRVTLPGDRSGVYYTYLVDGREACDPYARTTGVNGRRAMILDLASTNPSGWEDDADPHGGQPITDAVIYELHLRDLSVNHRSHIRHKGKFLGLTETGTSLPDGTPTGLDHIKALGITHVQLQPVFDFGSVDESRPDLHPYNWGYDPMNYNVPEGSYSTDPFHGAVRVNEMKRMVKALHDSGLSVVMDVVYNHVYWAEDFCFNRIVPGYFTRPDCNGSGCGNDTASERAMVRKYIVDSLCYWAEEYHIDGFRFDLVGLIDSQTVRDAMAAVHAAHPNVLFYGEGWFLDTKPTRPGVSLATQSSSGLLPGFGFFNDTLRDLLRGSVFSPREPGYVTGALPDGDALRSCFMGVTPWACQPGQSINYVSCHDNHTLFDRLALALPGASRQELIRRNNLAAAFCILSQGVPFFLAGEEMLRSKPKGHGKLEGNSYRSPDSVNALRWGNLEEPEYQQTLRYYRGLIAFRKAHPCLRLQRREDVFASITPIPCGNPRTLAFRIRGTGERLLIIFHADTQDTSFPLPEGQWQLFLDGERAGTDCLGIRSGKLPVPALSAMVLVCSG